MGLQSFWLANVLRANNGTWSSVGPQVPPASNAIPDTYGDFSLTFDPRGRPLVAMRWAGGFETTRVTRHNGTAWIPLLSTPPESVKFALAAHGDGVYLAVFNKPFSNGTGAWHLSVLKHNDTTGATAYVGGANFTTATDRCPPDVAVHSPTAIYVSFCPFNSTPAVMKFDGSSWAYLGAPGFAAPVRGRISLALSPAGVLFAALQQHLGFAISDG